MLDKIEAQGIITKGNKNLLLNRNNSNIFFNVK